MQSSFHSSLSENPESPRCQMVYASRSGDRFSAELGSLLQSRLRSVGLLFLVPLIYFFSLEIFGDALAPRNMKIPGIIFQIALIGLVSAITLLLWSQAHIPVCTLRTLEMLLFGSTSAFFAWMQFCQLSAGDFLTWVEPGSTAEQKLMMMLMFSMSLRWIFLILLYGIYVPNTWKRCTAMIVFAVLLSQLITIVAALNEPRLMSVIWVPWFSIFILLLVVAVTAVFGSSRILSLHKQAHEARELGQYRLLKKIGSGGMGEVHLAEHRLLRRPCAVKLIRPDRAGDEVTLSRFEREVQAMATLTHWCTVEIFDYGRSEDGTFYYVMEHLPGLTLDEMVESTGPLPPSRVIHFVVQICHALREAHAMNLLHRDIKPGNVIACERGGVRDVAKLLDFGLVHSLDIEESEKLTSKGAILGSPQFMSPEQARGKSELTPACDIYSLGCMAYFLLTGKPPFVRDTPMEMLIAHATENMIALKHVRPSLPDDLIAVIEHCMLKRPEDRYQDVETLERELLKCTDAGKWTEAMAADWWHEHQSPNSGDPALHDSEQGSEHAMPTVSVSG